MLSFCCLEDFAWGCRGPEAFVKNEVTLGWVFFPLLEGLGVDFILEDSGGVGGRPTDGLMGDCTPALVCSRGLRNMAHVASC